LLPLSSARLLGNVGAFIAIAISAARLVLDRVMLPPPPNSLSNRPRVRIVTPPTTRSGVNGG
jgi:hypothetical protein